MYRETKTRSVLKAASWRALGTLTTSGLVWGFTGEVQLALAVGALEASVKVVLYYLHERIWDRVGLGRRGDVGGSPGVARLRAEVRDRSVESA